MTKHEFSKFIINARYDLDMTLHDMGDALGVNYMTIWRWENKRNIPRPEAISFWIERVIGLQDD